MSGLSRVRTDLFELLVIPSLAPHPVETDRKSTGHGDLGNLPSPPQGQVENALSPRSPISTVALGSQDKFIEKLNLPEATVLGWLGARCGGSQYKAFP
jgi:hypothetical protein